MPTLAELQAAFARALEGDDAGAADWVVAGGVPVTERLAIYRESTAAIQAATLAAVYPAVRARCGEKVFAVLAQDYRRGQPSMSGDRLVAAAAFAAFLDERFAGTENAVLADLARLEWAWQEVLSAAESRAFTAAELLALPIDHHEGLVLAVAPAVRHLVSAYPIGTLWQTHRRGGAVATAEMAGEPDRLLLLRIAQEPHLWRLTAAEDAFIAALLASRPLDEAIAALEQVEATRDAARLVFDCIRLGVVDGVVTPATSRS